MCVHAYQARIHGEEQALAGPAERTEVRDRVSEAGGTAAASRALQPEGLCRTILHPPQQRKTHTQAHNTASTKCTLCNL